MIRKCALKIKKGNFNFNKITNEMVNKFVLNYLNKNTFKEKINGKEYFTLDIYTDYKDTMDIKTIKNIVNSDSPKDTFHDTIFDWYYECEIDMLTEAVNSILFKLNNRFNNIDYDAVKMILDDLLVINYPFNHYLNQEVCVNVVTDYGDSDCDFTCNSLHTIFDLETDEEVKEYTDNSSLIKLAELQGYNIKDVENAILNSEFKNSKFLESLAEESLNTTTCMNALTFLVKCTLGEFLDYIESKDNITEIKITKETNCGLVDYWRGAGSLINICLEKDITIPFKSIYTIDLDENIGSYSVSDIYSNYEDDWNGTITFHQTSNIQADFDICDVPFINPFKREKQIDISFPIEFKGECKENIIDFYNNRQNDVLDDIMESFTVLVTADIDDNDTISLDKISFVQFELYSTVYNDIDIKISEEYCTTIKNLAFNILKERKNADILWK